MIIGARSLVSGRRGRPARRVPRARAPRLPERGLERAGAAARRVDAAQRVAAAPVDRGPRRQGRTSRRTSSGSTSCAGASPRCSAASTGELALTGSTTDGVNAVLGALDLGRGDEVLTSDEEHPGVLAPLGRAARAPRRRGAHGAVRASWRGEVRPEHDARGVLARVLEDRRAWWTPPRSPPADALVLLDGAQGLGAVPSRRAASSAATSTPPRARSGSAGRTASATSTCARSWPARCPRPGRATACSSDSTARARARPATRTRAASTIGFPAPHQVDWALAALDVLEAAGLEARARARRRAGRRGWPRGWATRVAPRGRSTLVSWETADPEARSRACASEGFVVRNLPGTPYVRASVGAWSQRGASWTQARPSSATR